MKVSVITPFYNGNEYIEAYQNMMLKNEENLEEGDSLEVIIVNDSPGVGVAVSGITTARGNWRVIQNEKNMGIHASRVHGLTEASGEYVIFLDQDDLLREDALKCFLAAAKAKAEMALYQVYVANAVLEQQDREAVWYRTDYHKSLVGSLKTYLTIGTQIISPGQCLIPKALMPNYWMTHFCSNNGADDYFLWILMLEQGIPFTYVDAPLYRHVHTAKNLSSDTRVTDRSSYEFIGFLREDGDIPAEDLDQLEDMLRYKDAFRHAGKAGKLKLACKRPGLFLPNLIFKLRTKTKYGFNR